MRSRIQRAIAALFAAIIVCAAFCIPVSADVGPKPTLKVRIKNPPDTAYHVALLTYRSREPSQEEIEKYIGKYYDNGYYLFWSPVGKNVQDSNESGIYRFHYMVPSEFKVIVLTDDGTKYVSNEIARKGFHTECTFDIQTGVLKEDFITEYNVKRYAVSAVLCFIITIESEMLALFWFRLSFKKCLKHFFLINIITQIFLNVVTIFINNIWVWAAAEVLIITVESLYYRKRLITRNGELFPKRNVCYGIVANLFSLSQELPLLLIVNLFVMYTG